ncbi:unnamed protein product [Leuciscus chuanchicus]
MSVTKQAESVAISCRRASETFRLDTTGFGCTGHKDDVRTTEMLAARIDINGRSSKLEASLKCLRTFFVALTDVRQMIQDRLKKIKEIQHSVELKKKYIEKEETSSVELFTDLISSFEKSQSEQLKMMVDKQKAAEEQDEELHQELTELKKRNTELKQFSHTEDHLHIIQMCSSLDSRPHTKNWTETRIDSDVNVYLHRALAQLKKTNQKLNEKLNQTGLKFVQKFAVDVTLDPDTANPHLILSDDGKQVSRGDVKRDVPENPKRFNVGFRVLAKQGFSSGRFYYEVQVKGKTQWDLGVIRESINRKGRITLRPEEGLWVLGLTDENQYAVLDNPSVMFPLRVRPEKVGVFVDYEEGLISFYNVKYRSHIYSFTGQTFTDKLYPVFNPGRNDEGSQEGVDDSLIPLSYRQRAAGSGSRTLCLLTRLLPNRGARVLFTSASFGASGQLGKEQTLPSAEDLFSRYGDGLGQPDSATHRTTCSVGVELLEFTQAQDSGPTSKPLGVYGIRSRSNAARFASYEAASALDSRPSPEMGVATQHYHPGLSPNLQPVVGPYVSTGRSLDFVGPALNEELQCSICLKVFTDPVTTPCGHNFCRTCLREHRTHNTVPIDEESQEKKNHLAERQTDVHQMIQNRIKKIQEIQHSVDLRKRNTDKEKSSSVELFTDLIRSIERCQSEQLKMMEEQQKAAEKQAEDLIKELHQEITELKRRNTELEQLSHTDDHLHLIQTGNRRQTQYEVDVTLDPDTANSYFILSDDGKQVSDGDIEQDVPENPKRFENSFVLAKQGFSSGRFYYEVQVKGKIGWILGVARESIDRKGETDSLPRPEDGYWIMMQIIEDQNVVLDNPSVLFPLTPGKVGVFVDYEEGLVSFYDVESRSHIYSFTGQTFTEKLYPIFSPCDNDKGENSNPLIITPVS